MKEFEFCSECGGGRTRSPLQPDQPADSDLCAVCYYNANHPLQVPA